MSDREFMAGNIRRSHPLKIAEAAAAHLCSFVLHKRLALTIDDDGRVLMISAGKIDDHELIGIYENNGQKKAVAALILEDILEEIKF